MLLDHSITNGGAHRIRMRMAAGVTEASRANEITNVCSSLHLAVVSVCVCARSEKSGKIDTSFSYSVCKTEIPVLGLYLCVHVRA